MGRFISQYAYKQSRLKNYTTEDLEKFANKSFAARGPDQDCHPVPQVLYAFEEGKPEKPRICHHVVNIPRVDFPKLMQPLADERFQDYDSDLNKCSKVVSNAKTVESEVVLSSRLCGLWILLINAKPERHFSRCRWEKLCVSKSGHAVESERTQRKKRLQNRCQKWDIGTVAKNSPTA